MLVIKIKLKIPLISRLYIDKGIKKIIRKIIGVIFEFIEICDLYFMQRFS